MKNSHPSLLSGLAPWGAVLRSVRRSPSLACATLALVAGATTHLHAAAPVVTDLVVSPAGIDQPMTIYARGTDADNNLKDVTFEYRFDLNWHPIATVNFLAGQGAAWAQTNWVPVVNLQSTQIRATVSDTTSLSATKDDVYASSFQGTLVADVTVGADQELDVFEIFDIRTKLDPRAGLISVRIEDEGSAIFWSRDRVVLGPGFRADQGSWLIAAVDSNVNGYSDAEEAVDTDQDGLWDTWELDHAADGFSITDPSDGAADADSDGTSNAAEVAAGRDPFDDSDAAGMPSNYHLVIKVPETSYLKVNRTTWAIATTTPENP
jgi:hypothetical protein